MDGIWIPIVIMVLMVLTSAVKIVQEYERGVIFRLGRLVGARGPGLFFIIPILEKMTKIDLRTIVLDIPPQEVITRDNVTTRVNAVVYYRVMDPSKAVVQVEHFPAATAQMALTTLRGVIGQVELDEVLSERDKINKRLQEIIDEATDPWGVKVSAVEIKDVELPEAMQRAMASQAEAERNRRARIINAEGEMQASLKLADAAKVLNEQPGALYIRTLQTIKDATEEKATTVVVPLPIELMSAFGLGKIKDNE
ncbi:MAG: slipin family protein [Methanosarcinales archaeon]|nr:MAG: slipin family protein [Methanosarcinales archaeon]